MSCSRWDLCTPAATCRPISTPPKTGLSAPRSSTTFVISPTAGVAGLSEQRLLRRTALAFRLMRPFHFHFQPKTLASTPNPTVAVAEAWILHFSTFTILELSPEPSSSMTYLTKHPIHSMEPICARHSPSLIATTTALSRMATRTLPRETRIAPMAWSLLIPSTSAIQMRFLLMPISLPTRWVGAWLQ